MKPTPKVVIAVLAAIGALPFMGGAERAAFPEAVDLSVRSAPPPSSACQLTADALKEAGMHEALDDYWVAVAKCRNGSGVNSCLAAASDELDEALELVDAQYAARLDLCALFGPGAYDPNVSPGQFSANITNPYLPIVPGRMLVYEKLTPEGLERVEITHLAKVVVIDGVSCRAVRDTVSLDGELVEDTEDWFSQKNDGAVWYLGEIALNYEDGMLVDIEGSWMAGKDGAKPGIVMLAMPVVGAAYRQEFLPGDAEDVARVVSLGNTVVTPAGTFTGCLETEDWSPIEPGHVERKFYAPGIGVVKELDLESGESLELVQIIN